MRRERVRMRYMVPDGLPVLPHIVEPEFRGPDADHAPKRDEDRDNVRDHELHPVIQYTLSDSQ